MVHDSLTVNLSLATPGSKLAPGFRFHPTDEELVMYYLKRKACGKLIPIQAVTEIDVYKFEPCQLSECSSLKSKDLERYFFNPISRKYENGSRLSRATKSGYWKATGKDRQVLHNSQPVGMKKTLVFYSGQAPEGKRTDWVMHEYRILDEELQSAGVAQSSFVLCRIFQKSRLGPPNAERYAPFVEEEWGDDATIFIPGTEIEDDVANGHNMRAQETETFQNSPPNKALFCRNEPPVGSPVVPLVCKRKRSGDNTVNCEPEPETFSLLQNAKGLKQNDPNSSNNANGSKDSTMTSQDPRTQNCPSALLKLPLLDSAEPKQTCFPPTPPTFDASTLERLIPPDFLIGNLQNQILNVSMEKGILKIELMKAQAKINWLLSKVNNLNKEKEDLKRLGEENII